MKRCILVGLVFVCIIITIFVILWMFTISKNNSVQIEVTLAHSVSCQIGECTYVFRLYPYDSAGIYLLRVEKGSDFETKAIVSGYNYNFLDLKIHVVKLISGGVVLEVQKEK